MVSPIVNDFYLPLSRERLETYRPPSGSDLDILTNYFWNIDLSEALMPALHAVELALRNTIHAALTQQCGDAMWFYERGLLEHNQLGEFARALGNVSRKRHALTAGRIVAELTFGFWVTLLSAPYEQRIWQPNGYALLKAAFPHATASRKEIHTRFNNIRELRNRVAHHEAIWSRPNLLQEHTHIHEAINWISPPLHQSIHAVDNFPTTLGGRPQVRANLKARFNLP